MLNEIGSNFWLDIRNVGMKKKKPIDISNFGIYGKDVAFFSTGRASIAYVIEDIKCNKNDLLTVLLPAYTCHTVIQPFVDSGIEVFFYEINADLEIDLDYFNELIENVKPDIIFLHRYFGFDTLSNAIDVIEKAKSKDCIVIEDRTQSLFSGFKVLPADYVVGSFRKWGPIPDGGFCIKTEETFKNEKTSLEHIELVNKKILAFQSKNDYITRSIGSKDTFLKEFADAENILDNENRYYCMSKRSKGILMSLDVNELKRKRRENYALVYENINNPFLSIVTPPLSDKDVPLYITVITDNRDDLQSYLRNNNIYAPIIWPKPDSISSVSDVVEYIYREVLSLPIDQRYGVDEMMYMVDVVNSYKED